MQLRELSTTAKALQEEQEMGSGGRGKLRRGGGLTGSVRRQRVGGGASSVPVRGGVEEGDAGGEEGSRSTSSEAGREGGAGE